MATKPARDWQWGALLVFLVIIAYVPVWWAGYIWDDDIVLTSNPCIVGPLGLKEIWTTRAADICPFTLTTFWLEHGAWGLNPRPYHVVNVLMHAGCAVLFWRILLRLAVPGSWWGAALWALHPLQVESVAWITEMKNTESGLFFLATILCFLHWGEGGSSRSGESRGLYVSALILAALAMTSKSSTVILPVVLCLCAWRRDGQLRGRTLTWTAPFFLLAALASLLTVWSQAQKAVTALPVPFSWPQRLITAGDAVWFYVGKLIWPDPLVTLYPRWAINASDGLAYLPLVLAGGLGMVLWFLRGRLSLAPFLVFTYFVTALVPVLGLVSMPFFRHTFVADHLQYLASMGPLALAASGIVMGARRVVPGANGMIPALLAPLLAAGGFLSWHRAWTYQDSETLWTQTLAHNSGSLAAQYNLGLALDKKGQLDEAIGHYRRALQIDPDESEVHLNLGNALARRGETAEAVAEYEQAFRINPRDAQAPYNLGLIFAREGHLDECIAQFKEAIRIDPQLAEAHNNLGYALLLSGQIDAATVQFREALQEKPNYPQARQNLQTAEGRKAAAPGAR